MQLVCVCVDIIDRLQTSRRNHPPIMYQSLLSSNHVLLLLQEQCHLKIKKGFQDAVLYSRHAGCTRRRTQRIMQDTD